MIKFKVEEGTGRVKAVLKDRGWLESQTVEALLLHAILQELQELNQSTPLHNPLEILKKA